MGRWTFLDCNQQEQEKLQQTFDNPQTLERTKKRIGCSCTEDALEYTAKGIGPINTKFEILVKCVSCGKKAGIRHL